MSRQTYIPRDEYLAAPPAPAQTGGAEMSRLERALKDFNDYYEQITDIRFGARIGRLAGTAAGNALNLEYGRQLQKAEDTKRRIESVLGAWESVKSMVGLGALPLIPIAVALGLTLAIAGVVSVGRRFLRHANIELAMTADPDLTFEQAAAAVDSASRGYLQKTLDLAQFGVTAFVVWMVLKYVRE